MMFLLKMCIRDRLRTVPVVLDIIKDIEELCPNAWLVNFTNPTGVISEAVFKYTNFRRYIGLCNVPIGVKNGMADILDCLLYTSRCV